LTALALWPKGDTYYGGGLFDGPRELWLDTAYGEPAAHPDHPAGPLAVTCDRPEELLAAQRLARDGWTTTSTSPLIGSALKRIPRDGIVRERPTGAGGTVLRCSARRGGDRAYALVRKGKAQAMPGVTWAEVDPGRGVVFACDGRLLRIDGTGSDVREITDLSGNQPAPRPAPNSSRLWPHSRHPPGARASG
jgi:hypothetical protein